MLWDDLHSPFSWGLGDVMAAKDQARQDVWQLGWPSQSSPTRRKHLVASAWSDIAREELQATLQGVAIYRQPVTMDSLLKSFTGKRYTNFTGESPSREQMMKDLAPTDVRLLHDPGKKEQAEARRSKSIPEGKPEKVPVSEEDDPKERTQTR